MILAELLNDAEELQKILIAAIDASYEEYGDLNWQAPDYRALRQRLRADPRLRSFVPAFITQSRDPRQVIDFLEDVCPTYKKVINYRRYVYEQMGPLFERIEDLLDAGNPLLRATSDYLAQYEEDRIFDDWQKMMDRKSSDPSGTITAARTLVETVLHHVVREYDEESNEYDLDKLYKVASKLLQLDAADHDGEVFKKILRGCYSVVSGLANLRNDLGDAHGRAKPLVRASKRHAALAANIAATMSTFILETLEQRKLLTGRS